MKLVRTATAVAVGSALVLAANAGAATPAGPVTLTLTDQAGDANALNGGGLANGGAGPVTADGTVTPVGSQADKDLLSLVLSGTSVKVGTKATCTGFTAAITLSAAPTANSNYRVLATTATNTSSWWLTYNGTRSYIRYSAGTAASVDLVKPAVVNDKTITFTVTEADLKASGEKLSSFALLGAGVDARSLVPGAGATVPLWDEILKTEKTFKPC